MAALAPVAPLPGAEPKIAHVKLRESVRFNRQECTSLEPARHKCALVWHPLGIIVAPKGYDAPRVLIPHGNIAAIELVD